MSLILDALRKSDRQRSRQALDRLRDGPGPATAHSLPRWLLGGLLASVLLLAATLVLVVQLETARKTDGRSAAGARMEIMENEPVAVSIRPLGGELATKPARAETQRDTPAVTIIGPGPEPEAVPDSTPGIDDLNATPFDALPVAMRAQLPRLHVNIHAWSEDPQARFVLINLRRYQEGDRLQEGPLLRRILPDGVVLDSNGTLFSLPRQ